MGFCLPYQEFHTNKTAETIKMNIYFPVTRHKVQCTYTLFLIDVSFIIFIIFFTLQNYTTE